MHITQKNNNDFHLERIFAAYDLNKDGYIDYDEFSDWIREMNPTFKHEQLMYFKKTYFKSELKRFGCGRKGFNESAFKKYYQHIGRDPAPDHEMMMQGDRGHGRTLSDNDPLFFLYIDKENSDFKQPMNRTDKDCHLDSIFDYFSKDSYIDYEDFLHYIKIVQPKSTDEQINKFTREYYETLVTGLGGRSFFGLSKKEFRQFNRRLGRDVMKDFSLVFGGSKEHAKDVEEDFDARGKLTEDLEFEDLLSSSADEDDKSSVEDDDITPCMMSPEGHHDIWGDDDQEHKTPPRKYFGRMMSDFSEFSTLDLSPSPSFAKSGIPKESISETLDKCRQERSMLPSMNILHNSERKLCRLLIGLRNEVF